MVVKYLFLFCFSILLFANCVNSKTGQKVIQDKSLLARIIATEDKFEILTLLAGSPFSSDVGLEAYWANMFTEDAVIDMGKGRTATKGQTELLKIVGGADQRQAINFGMAHLAMLPQINIKGDSAFATGYLLTTVPDSSASRVQLPGKGVSPGFSIYQLTVNRWELIRTINGWKVAKRTVRPIMSEDSRLLLVKAIENSK